MVSETRCTTAQATVRALSVISASVYARCRMVRVLVSSSDDHLSPLTPCLVTLLHYVHTICMLHVLTGGTVHHLSTTDSMLGAVVKSLLTLHWDTIASTSPCACK